MTDPTTVIRVKAGPDNVDIPARDAFQQVNTWLLEHRDGVDEFRGRMLGFGSSFRREHNHDAPSHRITQRCAACRWFELRIFKTESSMYIVHSIGPSIIPNEITFSRISYTTSPYEVVELCTVRRGQSGEPYLPAAAARALSQAAAQDNGIKDAYVNRAVA